MLIKEEDLPGTTCLSKVIPRASHRYSWWKHHDFHHDWWLRRGARLTRHSLCFFQQDRVKSWDVLLTTVISPLCLSSVKRKKASHMHTYRKRGIQRRHNVDVNTLVSRKCSQAVAHIPTTTQHHLPGLPPTKPRAWQNQSRLPPEPFHRQAWGKATAETSANSLTNQDIRTEAESTIQYQPKDWEQQAPLVMPVTSS